MPILFLLLSRLLAFLSLSNFNQVVTSKSNFLHFSEYGVDGSKVYRRPKKAIVGAHAPVEGIRFSEYDTQDNKATLRTTSKLILDTDMERFGARKVRQSAYDTICTNDGHLKGSQLHFWRRFETA